MGKLSRTMFKHLLHLGTANGRPYVPFATGEALRRRGLVTRYTEHVTYAEHASTEIRSGKWPSRSKPMIRHEWWMTPAGRAALTSEQDK